MSIYQAYKAKKKQHYETSVCKGCFKHIKQEDTIIISKAKEVFCMGCEGRAH